MLAVVAFCLLSHFTTIDYRGGEVFRLEAASAQFLLAESTYVSDSKRNIRLPGATGVPNSSVRRMTTQGNWLLPSGKNSINRKIEVVPFELPTSRGDGRWVYVQIMQGNWCVLEGWVFRQFSKYLSAKRRSQSSVLPLNPETVSLDCIGCTKALQLPTAETEPSASLRLANALRVDRHGLRRGESLPNKKNAEQGDQGHHNGGIKHELSPSSHLFLGVQVLLGPLLFTIAAYYLGNAFSLGRSVEKSSASLTYFSVGLALIGGGVVALVAFLPALEALLPSN